MQRHLAHLASLLICAGGCASSPQNSPDVGVSSATQAVISAEIAFAKTMADRDFDAFLTHISSEAIFLNGGNVLRGRDAIGAHWRKFYAGAAAPFSWKPDRVEVLPSGRLAHSSGPVAAPNGKVFARFNSVWRLDTDGRWRVVFDDGVDVCDCAAKPATP